VLSGAALVSTDALAQAVTGTNPATGANAWSDGWDTSAAWPANPAPAPANAASMPVKAAPAPVEPLPYWWTHGELEVGGRFFANDPARDGSGAPNSNVWQQGNNLAKYYGYSIVAPGAFGGGHVATGSSDGLYQVDLWANNVGSYLKTNAGAEFGSFSDQSYLLTASKVGEQYFSAQWDQTPHVYSTTAQTIFNGVGTSTLTLPPGIVTTPIAGTTPATLAAIVPYLHQTDLGIQRNTAAFSYRATDAWTAWDARADYSYMTRTGTQPAGIVELDGFMPTNVPAPVDDSTQNFGANGEYLGTSPWGQKFTFKAAYNGSVYTDNISNYTVQNPFFPTVASCKAPTAAAVGTANCGSAEMSTWPSNAANGASETTTADLPFNSRYVGTTSYTMMTQNAAFLPMTNNPLAVTSPNGAPWNSTAALPAQSLAGNIDTLLSNNIVTTKITPTLTSKLSYKYYDFDNQTPRIIFPCWIAYDGTGTAPTAAAPCGPAGSEATLSSLSIGYIKQNAGAELNWRPTGEWNVNAAYGYEHYDYTEADAGFTNESSGKLSVDWKPTSWLTARASGSYADRTAGDYSYLLNVAAIQFPTIGTFTKNTTYEYSSAYQQFMFDNRQRTQANFLLDVVVLPGVTITPSVKYKDDYYPLNTPNTPATAIPEGLSDQKSLSTGVDVGWVITPDLSIVASYYYEYYDQLLYSGTTTAAPTAATLVTTTDKEYVNTVTAGVRWAAIPNTLDLDARYTISDGVDEQICSLCAAPNGPVFPNDVTLFERVDGTATYKFAPTFVSQLGWKGDIKARLRYTWERSSVSNWQNDSLAPFTNIPAFASTGIWMAWDNPNYNVQMLSASLIATW
jgi:MtrB/PioB family decaheme-associated outer membrane protein